jgi:hypothetical protein
MLKIEQIDHISDEMRAVQPNPCRSGRSGVTAEV